MKKLLISMLTVGLLASACSSDDDSIEPAIPESGVAHISFDCSTNPQIGEVIARAEPSFDLSQHITIPDGAAFNLVVSGSYFKNDKTINWTWPTAPTSTQDGENGTSSQDEGESVTVVKTVAEFNAEKPDIEAGTYNVEQKIYQNSYTATITYGDPNAEGQDKAYFAGTSNAFSVYPGKTDEVGITASLANSCFTLIAEEWLLKYYDNIELTIHTAENEFTFALNEQTASSPLIFVKSGQKLSFSGSAVKSQTGTSVEFPKTEIGSDLAVNTHYAIKVNHDTAGGAKLNILFGDTFTDVDVVEVELNDDVTDEGSDSSDEGDSGSGSTDNSGGTDDSGTGSDAGDGSGSTETPAGN